MRRDGKDAVGGQLRLAFAWDVTARSLMSLMLKALEHVLQQRREILCMLAPVSPHTAMTWSTPGSSAASTATLQVTLHLHAFQRADCCFAMVCFCISMHSSLFTFALVSFALSIPCRQAPSCTLWCSLL